MIILVPEIKQYQERSLARVMYSTVNFKIFGPVMVLSAKVTNDHLNNATRSWNHIGQSS
jgi:hypothetical protein